MFSGTFAGLLTVANLKPITSAMGLDETLATLSISVFAVGNVVGRIVWGQIHDRVGSVTTIVLSLGFLCGTLALLLVKGPAWAVLATTVAVGVGFGACFVVYASAIVHFFGIDMFPRLYPICFVGYGVAGLVGPAVGGWIADTTASYDVALVISVAVVLTALLVIRSGLGRPATVKIRGNADCAGCE
mgnify:CR=1 FL=1